MHHYNAYGFSIHSDVAFPAPEAGERQGASLAISRADRIARSGEPIGPFAHAGKDWIAFAVPGIVQFLISRDNGICYVAEAGADEADIATFLMNSALPCAAMLAGHICLRGTALAKDDNTLLLTGLPAKGKSSVAAAMVHTGYSVLSDGICVLDREARLLPGLGVLTLPQDALDQLCLPESSMVRTRPDVDRYHWTQAAAPGPAPTTVTHITQLIVQTVPRIDFTDARGAERLSMLRACVFRPNEFQRFGLSKTMLAVGAKLAAGARFRRAWRPVRDCTPSAFAAYVADDLEPPK